MLRCHIVLISWSLATTLATTSSDHIKQSIVNGKNLSGYSHAYSVNNDDRVQQRKTLTKYNPSNGHEATTTANLIFDNHPIYELTITTDNGNAIIIPTIVEANIPSTHYSWESLQPSISDNVNRYNPSTSRNEAVSKLNNIGLTNDTIFEPNILNSNDSIASSHRDDKNPMHFSIDDSKSGKIENANTIFIENPLFNEKYEMFGHRLQRKLMQQLNTTNWANPEPVHTEIAIADEDGPALRHETSSYNYKSALANLRKYFELDAGIHDIFDSTVEIPIDDVDVLKSQIELPESSNHVKIRGRNLRNEVIMADNDSKIKTTNKTTLSKPNANVEFSRPIVVAEISNENHPNDSTIFSCTDEHTKLFSPNTIGMNKSSSVTHKISLTQVTPTLLGTQISEREVGSASDNAGNVLTPTANVIKFIKNSSINTNQLSKNDESDETLHLSNIPSIINSTFDEFKRVKKISPHTSSFVNDQTVEVQKSLELYHSSPIQEIHYPAQFMPLATPIDQQRQQLYQTTQKHEKAKHTFQRNVGLYKDYIDFTNRNDDILNRYRLTVNPSVPEVDGLGRPSDCNDPTSVHVMNDENSTHPSENCGSRSDQLRTVTAQNNLGNSKNEFMNVNSMNELYLPYVSKSSHSIFESRGLSPFDNKLIEQNMSNIKAKVSPTARSIRQRSYSESTESSNDVHHLIFDKLSHRDKHLHQQHSPPSVTELTTTSGDFDYSKTRIDLIQEPIRKLSGLNKHHTDHMSIIDDSILPEKTQTKASNDELISHVDDDSAYIHTSNIDGRINNTRNYRHSTNNSRGKYGNYPVERLTYVRPTSHSVFTNNIGAHSGLYATQPHPATSIENILDETKNVMPYPFLRLVTQSYPVHIIQPYTVDKFASTPTVTYEDMVAKNANIPHESTYSVDIPVKISYPSEFAKYTEESIRLPYRMQYDSNDDNIMNQYFHKNNDKSEVVKPLNLPLSPNISSQNSRDYIHVKPSIPYMDSFPALSKRYRSTNQFAIIKPYKQRQQSLNYQLPCEKFHSSLLPIQTYTTTNVNHPSPSRWHMIHHNNEGFMKKNTGYLSSAPLVTYASNDLQQNQVVHLAHQELLRYSTIAPVATPSSLKRTKSLVTHYHSSTGNFKQSKMEYGFKPPLIPSLQYDE